MKIRLFIPLIFVCTASILQAQDATKKELLIQTSKALALDARNKFSKAVLAAKEKGWPIQYVSQNQEIYEYGKNYICTHKLSDFK